MPSQGSPCIILRQKYSHNSTLNHTQIHITAQEGREEHLEWLSQLTKTEHVLANLIEVVSLSFLRGVEDDDSGADDGEEAADLAVQVESLLQQVGGQHRTTGGHRECVSAETLESSTESLLREVYMYIYI